MASSYHGSARSLARTQPGGRYHRRHAPDAPLGGSQPLAEGAAAPLPVGPARDPTLHARRNGRGRPGGRRRPTRAWGIDGVFTLLGENLADLSEAQVVADAYHALLDEIASRGLDVEISLKLTQLGFDLDETVAFEHFDGLARHAAERGSWAWIDMEGSAYTEPDHRVL